MIRPTTELRQQEQTRPNGSPVMFQRWSNLAFAHWPVAAEALQATLPDRLQVDTFDGCAWIGLVPFFMERIRPRFAPLVPRLSWFLEMNVRSYVFDRRTGRPGVWFYSLDCNQSLAVWLARRFFHLPYFNARMSAQESTGAFTFECQRKGAREKSSPMQYSKIPSANCKPAKPGSLEFFLLERYLLFSQNTQGDIFVGQVHHEPYTFAPAEIQKPCHQALEQAGFPQTTKPTSSLFSPGVDVSVFPLKKLQ